MTITDSLQLRLTNSYNIPAFFHPVIHRFDRRARTTTEAEKANQELIYRPEGHETLLTTNISNVTKEIKRFKRFSFITREHVYNIPLGRKEKQ